MLSRTLRVLFNLRDLQVGLTSCSPPALPSSPTCMSKRRRTHTDSDTDVSEFLGASDGSYCEAPKSRSKKARKTRQVASKRARPSTSTTAAQGLAPSTGSQATVTHPTSWHVVTDVGHIQESLLHWYGQVHDVRGMPWRKTFDGSLDTDGRAQRAYEVRSREQPVIPPGLFMRP